MKLISKEEANKVLEDTCKLFIARGLLRTTQCVREIIQELNNNPDFHSVSLKFQILQTTFIVEYQGNNPHRTLCATFLTGRWSDALRLHFLLTKKTLNSKEILENRKNRIKSHYTLGVLMNILHKGAKTDEEKFVALCILYMYVIDGIYGKDLRDYYMWDRLSDGLKVDTQKLLNMKIPKLIEYFKKLSDGECLVEAWDDEIRNSVAHSSFYYDKNIRKMIFEEKRKDVVKELSFNELANLYSKLDNIHELIRFMNQIIIVGECIESFK